MPTSDEVGVLQAILGNTDPRLVLVAKQLETAEKVVRENPTSDTFRVRPEWTFENLNFPLEVNRIDSGWLDVVDAASQRTLRFRAAVGRSGFLLGLEGVTADDGVWPRTWSIGRIVDPPDQGLIALPSLADSESFEADARQRLSAWLEIDLPKRLTFYPPAPAPMIAAREVELGAPFPLSYRSFLEITDGLDGQLIRLHGYADVYQVDDLGLPLVLLAWDSDDRDDFLVTASLAGDERIYRVDVNEDEPTAVEIAPDFRSYLRRRIID